MARHAKEKTLDFYYLNKEDDSKKQKKRKDKNRATNPRPKNTKRKSEKKKKGQADKKEDIFNFDNEIVIGVNVIPDDKQDKPSKKQKNKPKTKQTTSHNKTSVKQKNKPSNTTKNKKKPVKKNKKVPKKSVLVDEEKLEKRKNRVKKVKLVLKCLLLLIIVIGIMSFLMISPIFNIVQIEVSGNETLTQEEVISLAGIEEGENTFRISNTKVQHDVKQNAYIEEVKMKRKLPNKIVLAVQERHATYMLEFGNSFVYLNNQGYILEIASEEIEKPTIRGYATSQEEIKPGNRLCTQDLERLDTILRIMESANNNEIASFITGIDISDKDNYTLLLETKGKKVYLGDASDINDRMLILKVILEKEEGNNGEVFLQDRQKVFFREQV